MILKPNMAISGKKCAKQSSVDEVAEKTLRLLKSCVPAGRCPALPSSQAGNPIQTHRPSRRHDPIGGLPWRLTFSYGRALQAAPQKAWSGKAENGRARSGHLPIGRG